MASRPAESISSKSIAYAPTPEKSMDQPLIPSAPAWEGETLVLNIIGTRAHLRMRLAKLRVINSELVL